MSAPVVDPVDEQPRVDLVDVVRSELARERETEREAREARRFVHPEGPGSGCGVCGVGSSRGRDREPGWTSVPPFGTVCASCSQQFGLAVADPEVTVEDRRAAIVRYLVGNPTSPWVESSTVAPLAPLFSASGKAPTTERFGFLSAGDVEALRFEWSRVVPPTGLSRWSRPPGDPCGRCGATSGWRPAPYSTELVCGHCRRLGIEHADVSVRASYRGRGPRDLAAAHVLGVVGNERLPDDPVVGLGERCEFRWFAETKGVGSTDTPWAYIGEKELGKMRAKIEREAVPA